MKWFSNLKIRHKFLVAAGSCVFFFVILSSVGLWGTSQIHDIVNSLNNDQIPEILNINEARIALETVQSSLYLALLAEDPATTQKAVAETRKNFEIVKVNLQRYINATHPADEAETVSALQLELKNFGVNTEKLLQLTAATTPPTHQELLDNLNKNNSDALEQLVNKIIQINSDESGIHKEEATQTFTGVIVIFGGFTLLVIILTVVAVLLVSRSISQPIQKLGTAMRALAEGDLTQQVESNHTDEIGQLGQTYNTTLQSLRNLIEQLHSQSQQVASATHELSVQARNQVTGSNQQASAIMETTQALQELSQTADNIALQATKSAAASENSLKQAQVVSQAADKMAQSQELGRKNVAQTIDTIFSLKEQVGAIEQHQQELQVQTSDIQRIVAIIDEISHETHLLALNAAIEAAGAGQYGDRFAVIAGEVKRLATNSVEATKEVRRSIAGITQAVERSSRSASEGVRQAEKATHEASQSDSTLLTLTELSLEVKTAARAIVSHIEQTATLATGIGVATQQQQVASQQVLQTMLSIEVVTAQNLSSVRQGDAATQQLGTSARELEHSANVFKLAA